MSKIAVVAGGGKVKYLRTCSISLLMTSARIWEVSFQKHLAKDGYGVVVHYNSASSKEESEQTIKTITDAGGQA